MRCARCGLSNSDAVEVCDFCGEPLAKRHARPTGTKKNPLDKGSSKKIEIILTGPKRHPIRKLNTRLTSPMRGMSRRRLIAGVPLVIAALLVVVGVAISLNGISSGGASNHAFHASALGNKASLTKVHGEANLSGSAGIIRTGNESNQTSLNETSNSSSSQLQGASPASDVKIGMVSNNISTPAANFSNTTTQTTNETASSQVTSISPTNEASNTSQSSSPTVATASTSSQNQGPASTPSQEQTPTSTPVVIPTPSSTSSSSQNSTPVENTTQNTTQTTNGTSSETPNTTANAPTESPNQTING